MKTPKVTINGFPVLGSGPLRWRYKEGVQPVIETFEVSPDVAKIMQAFQAGTPQPVTLHMEIDGREPEVIQNLFILQVGPGSDRFSYKVKLADRRWTWKSPHIERFYNMRRKVGVRSIWQYGRIELLETAPNLWYAPWTMKNADAGAAGKWTAHQAIADVLDEIARSDQAANISPFSYTISEGAISQEIPIEQLELVDKADGALTRLMGYMPLGAIRVNREGNVVVYSRADGGEKAVVRKIRPELLGQGHIRMVDNSIQRPRETHVLFSPEIEMRLNYAEVTRYSQAFQNGKLISETRSSDDLELELENVLPSPDPSIDLGDGHEIAEGQWITIDQAFQAWGPAPKVNRHLDHALVQKLFNPSFDLWGPLGQLGRLDPSKPWAARINALHRHYRQTFRIARKVMDKLWRIEGKRFASIEPQTGLRSCASVYSDHCLVAGQPLFIAAHLAGYKPENSTFAINVRGYPGGPRGHIDSDTWVSPATVDVLDSDQGIIRVEWKMHPLNFYEQVLPGLLDDDTVPSGDLQSFVRGASRRPLTFNSRVENGQFPHLQPNFKCAIILTAIPGAPNTDQKLVRVIIRPQDIAELVPEGMREHITRCNGPVAEIRVGPGVETARIPWFDDAEDRIKSLLGIPEVPEAVPNVDDLVVNLDYSSQSGGASLNAIAKAYAARVYASLCDHMQGQASGVFTKGVQPAGWVSEVIYSIDPATGEGMTTISMPDTLPPMQMLQFLTSTARAIVTRAPFQR